jgi:hypothetical protein
MIAVVTQYFGFLVLQVLVAGHASMHGGVFQQALFSYLSPSTTSIVEAKDMRHSGVMP